MDYTEKEKNGIDKVERMNSLFDRFLMPAIGVLIIMLLLSFIIDKSRAKFGSDDSEGSAVSVQSHAEPLTFALRRELMGSYSRHVSEFEAYGYEPVEGYSYDLSLGKTVDGEMSIFQFSDSALGELTIINYIPKGNKGAYDSLSLTVSSHRLINVTVKNGEEKHTVTFLSPDFSVHSAEDEEEFDALMELADMDEITAMYEIFETDISNLAKSCHLE